MNNLLFQFLLSEIKSAEQEPLLPYKGEEKEAAGMKVRAKRDASTRYVREVDLLRRPSVVARNLISINRFSRKSKPNGGINISLSARVSSTLFPCAGAFHRFIFNPAPFFSFFILAAD